MDDALRARIERLCTAMEDELVERAQASRLVLLAALAGEHVLLVGPPGTAKSQLARRLAQCFRGARCFERLLTRFSVPEELFGPLSIRGLERDEYKRLTDGYMPSAQIAFLDEIFKANSAILNALLTLLNEREFDNGTERMRTPLICVVAASNEIPDAAELAALSDRFLVRYRVDAVADESFESLLEAREPAAIDLEDRLTPDDLVRIAAAAREVAMPGGVLSLLGHIRAEVRKAGLYVSDRRWRKLAGLLKVAALTEGRAHVGLLDVPLAVHALWTEPAHAERVEKIVDQVLREVIEHEPERLEQVVSELDTVLAKERDAQEDLLDEEGHLLFQDANGQLVTDPYVRTPRTNADGETLFLAPPGMDRRGASAFTYAQLWTDHFSKVSNGLRAIEVWTRDERSHAVDRVARTPMKRARRFSAEHVESRLAQARDVLEDVQQFGQALSAARSGGNPLWLVTPFRGIPEQLQDRLRALVERLERIAKAFESLPRQEP